jgi:hypothetical protein
MCGVGRQVHHDLLDRGGVGKYAGRRDRELELELDRRRQGRTQEAERFTDDLCEVGRPPHRFLSTTEAEDRGHQFASPRRGPHDLVDVGLLGGILGAGERELGVAEDTAEDVVEVVGDATRQGADRLHLL